MSLRQKYLKIISGLVSCGAVGAFFVLGSALPSMSAERAAAPPDSPVSERLAAIRGAVFTMIGPEGTSQPHDRGFQLVWGNGWNNFGWGGRRWGRPGWGRPGWGNWRNARPPWSNFWRNW